MYLDQIFGLSLSLSKFTLLFYLSLYLDRTLAQRKAKTKVKVAQWKASLKKWVLSLARNWLRLMDREQRWSGSEFQTTGAAMKKLHLPSLVFYARQHICYSAYMLSPVRPSVTRVYHRKTAEVRIMKFSPYGSPIPLVFRDQVLSRNSGGSPTAGC